MTSRDQNKEVFSSANVVAGYASQSHLHPDEESVLGKLETILPTSTVLDIGVGGGRTTVHIAISSGRYVGTDYSSAMIEACKERFSDCPATVSFVTCDARSMSEHADNTYDVIFFSFNGIDCVSHNDRLKILNEIARIGKSGAWFYFTAHNLNWASLLFEWWKPENRKACSPLRLLKRTVLRYFMNFKIATKAFRMADHLIFNDGAHHWTIQLYYIRPLAQISQLSELFTDVRVFSTTDGHEMNDPDEIANSMEPYLGYLCRIK